MTEELDRLDELHRRGALSDAFDGEAQRGKPALLLQHGGEFGLHVVEFFF
jgi:hypothetical protein